MQVLITIIQIIISLILIVLILLQSKGVGLGRAWGGGGDFYKSKRGVEKAVFQATIVITIFFLIVSILNLFVKYPIF